jgi:RNA polymerase sigma-70 factor (ECF subfamily)
MQRTISSPLMAEIEGAVPAVIEDFTSIVKLHRLKVFRFALVSLRDKDAAQTVTQDCFLKAHKYWGVFRQECSVDTWLMRIAVNLVRDYLRNRRFQFWKRVQQTAMPVDATGDCFREGEISPETRVLLGEQVAAVWDAAGKLPARQQTVFLLRFVEEMELIEIANATGMKEGTVKAHLFRALKAVRKRVGVRQ